MRTPPIKQPTKRAAESDEGIIFIYPEQRYIMGICTKRNLKAQMKKVQRLFNNSESESNDR